jgi:hypothetical protein
VDLEKPTSMGGIMRKHGGLFVVQHVVGQVPLFFLSISNSAHARKPENNN